MRESKIKRSYCAQCGRKIQYAWIETIFQDEEGRIFKFHGFCAKVAAKIRAEAAKELAEMDREGGG